MPEPAIGIGTALRRARMVRGRSLDEAARDTKIKPSALQALEDEAFSELGGDVYTRAFLRSYSQYLGLDPDKVVGIYAERAGDLEPAPPPAPTEEQLADTQVFMGGRRGRWLIAGGLVVMVVIVAGVVGLFFGNKSVPPPVPQPTVVPTAVPPSASVTVAVTAGREVQAVIIVDGQTAFSGTLLTGEARSFTGSVSVSLQFSKGGVVEVSVNGKDLGSPGSPGAPSAQTFYAATPTPPSMSPAPSATSGPKGVSPSPR